MPTQPRIYRRLPGRGTNLAQYFRLYRAPDHLLQVTSTGYSESYKRFYFRDIQAIIVRRNGWRLFWNIVWGVLTATFALPALASNGAGAIALWIVAGIFLMALLVNWASGPTCSCHVRTAVQIEKLPMIKRLRGARRMLDRIKPPIDEAQGRLSTETPGAHLQTPSQPSSHLAESPPVIQEDPPAPELPAHRATGAP